MNISVNGKQTQVGDALRGRIQESLEQVADKYFGRAMDATVTLSREGTAFRIDISAHVARGLTVEAHGTAHDAHAAFDVARERVEKRLRRHKRRLKDHNRENGSRARVEVPQFVLAGEPVEEEGQDDREWSPAIVAELPTTIETLSLEDAVMRLDLGDMTALMFHNAGHGGLNTIYRRPDGSIGWIDPQASPGADAKT